MTTCSPLLILRLLTIDVLLLNINNIKFVQSFTPYVRDRLSFDLLCASRRHSYRDLATKLSTLATSINTASLSNSQHEMRLRTKMCEDSAWESPHSIQQEVCRLLRPSRRWHSRVMPAARPGNNKSNVAAVTSVNNNNNKSNRSSSSSSSSKINTVQKSRRKVTKIATSVVMLITDGLGAKHSRSSEYLINLLSGLGIPTVTWLPSQLGQILLEEGPMTLRTEPSNRHLAMAMTDFLQKYNWKFVALVVNSRMSGSANFVQLMREVVKERSRTTHPRHFEVKIVEENQFDGLRDAAEMTQVLTNPARLQSYRAILQRAVLADHRILLFYGIKYDLIIMHKLAFSDPELAKVFGSEFVWIVGPETITPVASIRWVAKEKFSPMLDLFEDLPPLPGVFGFAYSPTWSVVRKKIYITAKFWNTALALMANSNSSSEQQQSNSNFPPTYNCRNKNNSEVSTSNFGQRLHRLMKNLVVEDDSGGFYSFSDHGYLNSSEFLVMNTRAIAVRSPFQYLQQFTYYTKWYKVGSWHLHSRYGDSQSKLQIDGVTWPGGGSKPPLGRPSRIRLRVSTLREEPFVIFSPLQDKTCSTNALQCKVLTDSIDKLEKSVILSEKNDYTEEEKGRRRRRRKRRRKRERMKRVRMRNSTTEVKYIDACCTGMTIDLVRELMKDLNFEVDLYEVADRKWGSRTSTGGYDGLLNSLISKQADMTATAFKITPNRSELVEFTVPFQETGIAILVSLKEGSISPTAFLKPYDWASWMVILIFSVHCCGTAMFIYEWLSPMGLDRGNVPPREHRFSLFRALWLIWTMLFGAAVNVNSPRGVASRFLGCIWALFGLVFLASYTANLAAFMIAKEDYLNLEGINDWRFHQPLKYKPEFRFATVLDSATEENIELVYPKMARRMKIHNKTSVDEAVVSLKQREIDAFIYDSNVLEYRAAKDENCKLRTVGNLYAVTGYGLAFPKGSLWLERINKMIMQYQKYDNLHRWKRFWLTGACKKSDKLGKSNRTLGVRNFISAFILLLGGLIVSGILLSLEHLFYRYLRPRISRLDQYGCCGLVSLSMGQLLSFEQTVNQTVDWIKKASEPCYSPLCERRLQKLSQELHIAQSMLYILQQENKKLRNTVNALMKNPGSTVSQINDYSNKGTNPVDQLQKQEQNHNLRNAVFDSTRNQVAQLNNNNNDNNNNKNNKNNNNNNNKNKNNNIINNDYHDSVQSLIINPTYHDNDNNNNAKNVYYTQLQQNSALSRSLSHSLSRSLSRSVSQRSLSPVNQTCPIINSNLKLHNRNASLCSSSIKSIDWWIKSPTIPHEPSGICDNDKEVEKESCL